MSEFFSSSSKDSFAVRAKQAKKSSATQIYLEPPARDGSQKVILHIGFQTRYIGKISGETFSAKRGPQHLFRKRAALGLSYDLLVNDDIFFRWIVIDYSGQKLVTSRRFWLAVGTLDHFVHAGFEKQVFLPLSRFGIAAARNFEAVAQAGLFHD